MSDVALVPHGRVPALHDNPRSLSRFQRVSGMRFEGQWEAEGPGQPSELALPPSHGEHLECVHWDLPSTGMVLFLLSMVLGSGLEKGPEILVQSAAVVLAAPVRPCWWGWPPLLPHHGVTSAAFGAPSPLMPWWRRLCRSYLLLAPRSRRRGFGRLAPSTPPPPGTLPAKPWLWLLCWLSAQPGPGQVFHLP